MNIKLPYTESKFFQNQYTSRNTEFLISAMFHFPGNQLQISRVEEFYFTSFVLIHWQNIYHRIKKYYFCTLWTEISILKKRRVVLTLRNVLYLEVLYRIVWQDSQAYLYLWWEWEIFLQLQTLPKDRRHTMLEVYCNNRKLSFNINHY